MLSHSSTAFELLLAAYTLIMGLSYARAFVLYFSGDRLWTGPVTVGNVMLLLMIMSLML